MDIPCLIQYETQAFIYELNTRARPWVGLQINLLLSACTGDHGEESLYGHLQMKSGEMEEEKVNGVQSRELVRDDTEPPRGECESIVHPENPDGDVEVSLCFIDIQHNYCKLL